MRRRSSVAMVFAAFFAFSVQAVDELELEVFGKVKVVDEIDCTKRDHRFREYPEGGSKVETVLGRECLTMPVMPYEASYLAWRIGEGKGLKINGSYVIVLEYPDDGPRNYVIHNRATDSKRSFCTGQCQIDCWSPKYVNNNSESLKIPQTGKWERWVNFTTLMDWTADLQWSKRVIWEAPGVPKFSENGAVCTETVKNRPEDGFDFAIAQYGKVHEPISLGLAVAKIYLCEIPDEGALYAKIPYPAGKVPRRHIFWREEMSDNGPLGDADPQCSDRRAWFRHKVRQIKMLGMNTFCRDLMEFGHVQSWDPDYIRKGWAWTCATRWLWAQTVEMLAKEDVYVLPYYEWCGNIGWEGADPPPLGTQKRCRPLKRNDGVYTQIAWSEKANLDITDPESLRVTKELLDGTILRFKEQLGMFCGAFFRTRNSNWPVSFADATIARFKQEKYGDTSDDELFGAMPTGPVAKGKRNRPAFDDDFDSLAAAGDKSALRNSQFGREITRETLARDGRLYKEYLRWWHKKRAEFLVELQKYLVEKGVPEAMIVFDSDCSEPGRSISGGMQTDDPELWRSILTKPPFNEKDPKFSNPDEATAEHLYIKSCRAPAQTYKDYEWQHACPGDDPETYSTATNVHLAMSINRMYSVWDPDAFKIYRNAQGVNTVIRHYPLNENMVYRYDPVSGEEARILGYAIHDTERAGRASMMVEVSAMANGDPANLGYLVGSTFSRGFPGPVREFNLNFLALPALPAAKVGKACDNPDVTLKMIDATKRGSGCYFYLTHEGYRPVENVVVRFPKDVRNVRAIVGGETYAVGADGSVTLPRLEPWQLLAFERVAAAAK